MLTPILTLNYSNGRKLRGPPSFLMMLANGVRRASAATTTTITTLCSRGNRRRHMSILKGVPRSLCPDLLHALASMGHGDSIVIADANFPGTSVAAACSSGRIIRADGVTASDMLRDILTLMPLDTFVDRPAAVMAVVGDADKELDVYREFAGLCTQAHGSPVLLERVERFAFYERAKAAFAIVQTGEKRLYGNIMITKGVIS